MKLRMIVSALLCALLLTSCGGKKAKTQESSATDQKVQIEWATFNIRYDNPGDSLNNWKYRKDTVCKFILEKHLDIVGMQEVLHNQLDFWLSQYPDSVGFIGWDGACTRIATWAKLKDKATGKIFMAVNTHFDHVGVEARRQGALLIIQRIKEIVGNQPAVVTGDFNVNDQSEAYQTMTTNEFVLKDAYKMTDKKSGPAYTFHDYGRVPEAQREKIDFIFVTPQIKVLNTEIAQNPETKTGYLSDHNPHIALLEF